MHYGQATCNTCKHEQDYYGQRACVADDADADARARASSFFTATSKPMHTQPKKEQPNVHVPDYRTSPNPVGESWLTTKLRCAARKVAAAAAWETGPRLGEGQERGLVTAGPLGVPAAPIVFATGVTARCMGGPAPFVVAGNTCSRGVRVQTCGECCPTQEACGCFGHSKGHVGSPAQDFRDQYIDPAGVGPLHLCRRGGSCMA